jgi:hypothetical protein
MKAILWICGGAVVAFGLHFASFALIPPTRGPSVRVSQAVLHIAERVLGEQYVTDYNFTDEYPRGSLHATGPGQKILIGFWLLVYLLVFSLVYFVFAGMRRSRVSQGSKDEG